jgi:microcystin-dependent protein
MEPFLGEIRLFAGTFAPVGWNLCDGSLLPIAQNDALYALIGTVYGGDGTATFAVPDLRSRVPVHQGTGGGQTYTLGLAGGQESVTLTPANVPPHTHALSVTGTTGSVSDPTGALLAPLPDQNCKVYLGTSSGIALAAGSVGNTGNSQPHENRQPFLAFNYIIATAGVWPSQQ